MIFFCSVLLFASPLPTYGKKLPYGGLIKNPMSVPAEKTGNKCKPISTPPTSTFPVGANPSVITHPGSSGNAHKAY